MKTFHLVPFLLTSVLAVSTEAVVLEPKANITLNFYPDPLEDIEERSVRVVAVNVTGSGRLGSGGTLRIRSKDPGIAELVNSTSLRLADGSGGEEQSFLLRGVFLGRTEIVIELSSDDPEVVIAPEVFPVAVIRDAASAKLSSIFTAVVTVLTVINTFVMGTQLDKKVILGVLKKPVAPAICLFIQAGLMPLVAFGWGSLIFPEQGTYMLAYLAMGCAPGSNNANFWSYLLEGNLDLSVTMVFITNVAAFVVIPFWIYTLGRVIYLGPGGQVTIPFANIVASLLGLIGPIFVGMLVVYFKPQVAEKLRKVIKVMTIIILIIVISFGSYVSSYVFYIMTWQTIVTGFLLPWSGYLIGYFLPRILRQEKKDCLSVCLVAGIHNSGIAMVMLLYSLPHPDSDLSIVVPISSMIFTSPPLWLCFISRFIVRKLRERKGKPEVATELGGGRAPDESNNNLNREVGDADIRMSKENSRTVLAEKVEARPKWEGQDNPAADLRE